MHLMHLTCTIVCITHAYHAFRTFFLTNFAPIMSHKILLISCDNRIKLQNIVWIQKKILLRGAQNYICAVEQVVPPIPFIEQKFVLYSGNLLLCW